MQTTSKALHTQVDQLSSEKQSNHYYHAGHYTCHYASLPAVFSPVQIEKYLKSNNIV